MKLDIKGWFLLSLMILSLTSFKNKVLNYDTTSCVELIKNVKSEAKFIDEVSQVFTNSQWLKGVKLYQYDDTYFVIASIKAKNDYSYSGKEYIFCGISKTQWTSFKTGIYDVDLTYGERFHKYIIEYQCNCQ